MSLRRQFLHILWPHGEVPSSVEFCDDPSQVPAGARRACSFVFCGESHEGVVILQNSRMADEVRIAVEDLLAMDGPGGCVYLCPCLASLDTQGRITLWLYHAAFARGGRQGERGEGDRGGEG